MPKIQIFALIALVLINLFHQWYNIFQRIEHRLAHFNAQMVIPPMDLKIQCSARSAMPHVIYALTMASKEMTRNVQAVVIVFLFCIKKLYHVGINAEKKHILAVLVNVAIAHTLV